MQVTHPLQDHESIAARLDAVTEIAESMGSVGVAQGDGTFPGSGKGGGYVGALSRGDVGEGGKGKGLLVSLLLSLGKLPDVQRGITRIFLRTATAAEVLSVLVLSKHSYSFSVVVVLCHFLSQVYSDSNSCSRPACSLDTVLSHLGFD